LHEGLQSILASAHILARIRNALAQRGLGGGIPEEQRDQERLVSDAGIRMLSELACGRGLILRRLTSRRPFKASKGHGQYHAEIRIIRLHRIDCPVQREAKRQAPGDKLPEQRNLRVSQQFRRPFVVRDDRFEPAQIISGMLVFCVFRVSG
jgi:hypothetical protein